MLLPTIQLRTEIYTINILSRNRNKTSIVTWSGTQFFLNCLCFLLWTTSSMKHKLYLKVSSWHPLQNLCPHSRVCTASRIDSLHTGHSRLAETRSMNSYSYPPVSAESNWRDSESLCSCSFGHKAFPSKAATRNSTDPSQCLFSADFLSLKDLLKRKCNIAPVRMTKCQTTTTMAFESESLSIFKQAPSSCVTILYLT